MDLIQPSELRIGNYILFFRDSAFSELHKIKHLHPNGVLPNIEHGMKLIFWNEINPINLTEEWLLKFGFYEAGNGWFANNLNEDLKVGFNKSNELIEINFTFNPIKHVHQLQNLYFALTGEELTIK